MIPYPAIHAVCFDMDGTLLDTNVDYMKMTNLIFDEMIKAGVPSEEIDRSNGSKFEIESGTNWLIQNGRESEIFDINLRISKPARDVEMENVNSAKPFPGVVDLLKKLRTNGYKIGVLTRGCREYAENALRISKVSDLIDSIVARDDFPETEAKPSPIAMGHIAEKLNVSTDEILFLGDHRFDYQCARDAGTPFIGVLSGTFGREDWLEMDENIKIIDSVKDMMNL